MLKSDSVDCISAINGDVSSVFEQRLRRLDNAVSLTSIDSMKEKLGVERKRIVAARDDVLSTLKRHLK